MNSIFVTHVSSWQLTSELRKKCCGTPKSWIWRGRFYSLLYCLCMCVYVYIYIYIFISGPFWWFLRLLTITQRKLSTIPLLERTGIYSHGSHIKSSRSQYRQCSIITLQVPELPKITVIYLESGQVCCMEPRVCELLLRLRTTWKGQSALSLPPPVNSTDHSLLWPTAIPQGSLTRF